MKKHLLFILSFLALSIGVISAQSSLYFDGVDDFVDCGNDTSLKFGGDEITLEAMIKVDQLRAGWWEGVVLSRDMPGEEGYMLRVGGNGYLNFTVGDENTTGNWYDIFSPENTIKEGEWTHIAGTLKDSVMTLYVNGVEVASNSAFPDTAVIGDAHTVSLYIGESPSWNGRVFNGKISNVRIWSVTRTATEIFENIDTDLTGTETGLVANYEFGEGTGQDLADETGDNDGILGSTTDPDVNDPVWAGIFQESSSLKFDGADDYVNCGNDASLQFSSAITVEAWIKAPSFKPVVWQGTVLGKANHAPEAKGFFLRVGGSGEFDFGMGHNGLWNEVNSGSGAIVPNQWTHIAATYDGDTIIIYKNGVGIGGAGHTGDFLPADDAALFIGEATLWPGRAFIGNIDDVRVWNVARSQSEITEAMYTTLVGTETGLVACYEFEEGTGQVAGDKTGTNDGELGSTDAEDDNDPSWLAAGADPVPAVYPGGQNSLTFDGADDFVDCGNDASLHITGDFTLEAWINPKKNKGGFWEGTILSKDQEGEEGYMLRAGAGHIDFNVGEENTAGAWYNVLSPAGVIAERTWTHVAGTVQDSILVLYVNGYEVARDTVDLDGGPGDAADMPLYIGESPTWNGRVFDGMIDEVRVWNVARTPAQIQTAMNLQISGTSEGLVAYYKNDDSAEMQVSPDATGTSNGTLGSTTDADDNDPLWTVVAPVAYDGNNAIVLDGVNDYVNVGNDASLQISGTEITLEAFIKPNGFKDPFWAGVVLSKDQGGPDEGYMLRVGGNGMINMNIGGEGDGWHELNSSDEVIADGEWNHITGTLDGNTMTLYVNGVVVATDTFAFANGIGKAETKPLFIGESPSWNGRAFVGDVDEVRIWNVARSMKEIRENIGVSLAGTETGLVSYYQMEEGCGQTTANAVSSEVNTGILGSTEAEDDNDPGWVIVNDNCAIVDTDEDGVTDAEDNCPETPNEDQADADEDGVGDVCDNCADDANEDQADTDEDTLGDVCDNCPEDANADQADTDEDTVGDVCDNCPDDANTDQADADEDGIGDVCDPVGIDNIVNDNLKAYPIPFTDQLKVSSDLTIESISVNNIIGKTIIQSDVNNTETTLQLGTLSDGVYYITVQYSDGNVKTLKTVKK